MLKNYSYDKGGEHIHCYSKFPMASLQSSSFSLLLIASCTNLQTLCLHRTQLAFCWMLYTHLNVYILVYISQYAHFCLLFYLKYFYSSVYTKVLLLIVVENQSESWGYISNFSCIFTYMWSWVISTFYYGGLDHSSMTLLDILFHVIANFLCLQQKQSQKFQLLTYSSYLFYTINGLDLDLQIFVQVQGPMKKGTGIRR